jgi:hypothetical protein
MQITTLVRNLRFAGLVIGFAVFAVTMIHWVQYSANVQVVQNSPLIARGN